MSDAPEMKKVRARDVVPYEWAVYCTMGDDPKPFANAIELVKWSEDGQHLWFLLGTHNTYKAAPDEEVELVPCVQDLPDDYMAKVRREHAKTIAARPIPVTQCSECNGTGRVPINHRSSHAKETKP